MPTIDPRVAMKRERHFYFGTSNPELGPMLPWRPEGPPFTCLGHFDEAAQKLKFWYAGPDSAPEEPVFVPRSARAPEGEGWLLTMLGRRRENRTNLVILDAAHIERGPVARRPGDDPCALSRLGTGTQRPVPARQAGKLRLLGVSGPIRFKYAPQLPTFAEQGITGLEVRDWFGVFVAGKLPPDQLTRLAPLVRAACSSAACSPQALESLARADLARGTPIVKAAGFEADV